MPYPDLTDPSKNGFPGGSPIYTYSPQDQRTVIQALLRIKARPEFVKFWDQVLTDGERQELGDDIDACYKKNTFSSIHLAPLREWSSEQAIIEIAYRLNYLSSADYERFGTQHFGASGIGSSSSAGNCAAVIWDRDSGRLMYNGQVCRTVKVARATSVVPVLDEFEKAGWPESIKGLVDTSENPQRIYEVVRRLNRDLEHISFTTQGESIIWSPTVS